MKQSLFKFHPIYKERPWGNGAIARVPNHTQAPEGKKIGESWEISDRPDNESVIASGPFQGKTIRWLLDEHGTTIMGCPWEPGRRFPLLVKLLDAEERLSLQVHPPAALAAELKGEPKTELWYLLATQPGAALIAGLRKGVTREAFEMGLQQQTLEELLHRIPVQRGDTMFVPSGRLHAIDAGCLILEIQQNSDTTYRAYDWGHLGLDGKPRELHVEQTLRSTNFQDFEPSIVKPKIESSEPHGNAVSLLAECESFSVRHIRLQVELPLKGKTSILHVLKGPIQISSPTNEPTRVEEGETILLSASPHTLTPLGHDREFILTGC